MPVYKDFFQTVQVRHIYCDSCGSELQLRTITVYRPSSKDDPGISYEYFCPRCRESIFQKEEYPKILPKKSLHDKTLDK